MDSVNTKTEFKIHLNKSEILPLESQVDSRVSCAINQITNMVVQLTWSSDNLEVVCNQQYITCTQIITL